MAQQIIDLQGNVFQVGSRYKFCLEFPVIKNAQYIYNKDRLSDKTVIIIIRKSPLLKTLGKRYYYCKYIPHLGMYLLRKLKYIRYEEAYDIKYEWKYRKKGSKKNT